MLIALEFPVVPTSVVHIIDCYLNMTMFLAQSSETYSRIELDNILGMLRCAVLSHKLGSNWNEKHYKSKFRISKCDVHCAI